MKRTALIAAALTTFAAVPAAMADHNSQDGMGSANMPNDIHNVRLDVRLNDADNSYFTDFVQYGDGADVENRCLDDDPTTLCEVYDVGE